MNYTQKAFNIRSMLFTLLSIIPLWLTIQNSGLQWSHLQLSIEQWAYFVLSVIVLLLTVWLQSIRVKIPWENQVDTKNFDTLNGLFLGSFYNCILPGNLGEGIRAWHLSRKNKVSFVNALASLGVEKYIDALNFILYTIILVALFSHLNIRFNIIILFSCLVTIIFVFYLLIITQRRMEKIMYRILRQFMKAGRWFYKLHYYIKGFLVNLTKQQLARYLILGYIMFALNALQYFLVMKATGVPSPLASLSSAFLVAVAMVLVYITPSAPGNVGVVHYGIYSLLLSTANAYGIATNEALLQSLALYTVYLQFSYFLPEVVVGLLVVIKEKRWLL